MTSENDDQVYLAPDAAVWTESGAYFPWRVRGSAYAFQSKTQALLYLTEKEKREAVSKAHANGYAKGIVDGKAEGEAVAFAVMRSKIRKIFDG